MDDSGSRRPDHDPTPFVPDRPNAFALGGILVRDTDEDAIRAAHAAFCARWEIEYPLHSVDLRQGSKNFSWLRLDQVRKEAFLSDLEAFLLGLPVRAIACVIDRPGYDVRYRAKYEGCRWHLCKTAFCVAVERAAKHALAEGMKLRVYPERCSKKDDGRLRIYYQEMRTSGLPFDSNESARYKPLSATELSAALYELDFKNKSSPLAQLADLYLWPQVMHGYREYRPMERLLEVGLSVDSQLSDADRLERGTKYSCFELVRGHRVGA